MDKSKRSIRTTISIVIIGLVAGTVVLCWLLNTLLLENYYRYIKMTQLEECFGYVDKALSDGGEIDDALRNGFENICREKSISGFVITDDSTIVLSSESDNERAYYQFMDLLLQNPSQNNVSKLLEKENYSLQEVKARRTNTEYISLWGNLSDGKLIMIRTPVEGMRDSIDVSNRFLLYVGISAIIVSVVVAILLTRQLTKPMMILKDISIRMAHLDFTARYVSENKKETEIDELGNSMNFLSDKLQETISELKTANNELLTDIEKRDKIDEMRGEFIANVSHELKTPLALISGYCEGLKECVNDDAESRDFYCEVIMDETEKMTKMVQKLLTLNRLEFGGKRIELERFDLSELIHSVVQANGLLAEKKEVIIKEDYPEGVYAWADAFEIEEVITNYVVNAINHVDNNRQIEISLEDDANLIRVRVFNSGKHIPDDSKDKIWEKFYKVDKARTREYGGSGIGLSIVKAIMDNHHRDCGFDNVDGGVSFWFDMDKN